MNNQPQLDREKNERYSLNDESRQAEIRRFMAASTLDHRRVQLLLEYNNDLRQVEEVERGDAETIRKSKELGAGGRVPQRSSHHECDKGTATPLVRYETTLALPTAPFAILPGVWLWHCYARRIAIARGMCAACGYNLTGNTSGVCPECGTPVADESVNRFRVEGETDEKEKEKDQD